MNYGGSMPDWHQYNVPQANEVTPVAQNVNSGHMTFIPGVSPSSLNAINLSSEALDKHQNDANFNPRHYQPMNNVSSSPNIANNAPLTSMVQMQNCIGHYGSPNARNPMLDNLNAPVDTRNNSIGAINDDLGYRSNQVPFNGSIAHLSGPNCNINASTGPGPGPGSAPGTGAGSGSGPGQVPGPGSGSGPGSRPGLAPGVGTGAMGPRNTNVSSVPTGRSGPPPFIPCKGLCCNPDQNMSYQQWDKFGSYQNNTVYRDNVRPSGYQTENRRFGNNFTYRKDGYDGKESGPMMPNVTNTDHRRNFTDYKYHKDHLVSRNYSAPSGMMHNYPVQNYNYTGEYQKYPYTVKEHPKTNSMNVSNPGMYKHQEQNYVTPQKYNNKQIQYQNGNLIPKAVPSMNVNPNVLSPPQNAYPNPQFTRNLPSEVSHECQKTTENTTAVNRIPPTYMHGTHPRYQMYRQKIAMQRYSMENHLKELTRIPGYQSHPRYKECILRYKEILKLQQSITYPNQMQQSSSRIATPVNSAIPPINLQFDQNGTLINSNFLPENFPRVQHMSNTEHVPEHLEKHNKDQDVILPERKQQESQQAEQLIIQSQSEHASPSCSETYQKQNQFTIQKDFNQNQLKVQKNETHFDGLRTDANNDMTMQQKVSKEFANKPDLDVRQFLANWDETDDEEGTIPNLSNVVLSDSTPVVVVSYENVDLSTKTSQSTEISKHNFCPDEMTFNNGKKDETGVITTQDCLTISYSPSEDTEISKTSEQTTTEGIVKPGSIIHCVSNGPDDIPTIHIVDNLEISKILASSNQIAESLESQKTISFFGEGSNNETQPTTHQNVEHKNREASELSTAFSPSLDSENNETHIETSNSADSIQNTAVAMSNQELQALSVSPKNTLDPTQTLNLKKQNSFTSEESHNPDDISLPDLPTSECTPISTTLNTPIHSDSEESPEHIEDLTISTNPIEIMQNSPVISFTQSPVKIEPYGQLNNEENAKTRSLDTLELEFQEENYYKNKDSNNHHEEDLALNNFEFSPQTCRIDSNKAKTNKQIKNSGKKGDLDPTITSIEYKEITSAKTHEDNTENSNINVSSKRSMSIVHAESDQSSNSSTETSNDEEDETSTVTLNGSSMTVASSIRPDNETHFIMSKKNLLSASKNQKDFYTPSRQEVCVQATINQQNLNTTSNINSDVQQTVSEESESMKKTEIWGERFSEKNSDKNMNDKQTNIHKSSEHLNQFKNFDVKKLDKNNLNSSESTQHLECHTTPDSKSFPIGVTKRNIAIDNKKLHDNAGKCLTISSVVQHKHSNDVYCQKMSQAVQSPNNNKEILMRRDNAKESSTGESRKSKSVIGMHEKSRNSKKFKSLQKHQRIINANGKQAEEEAHGSRDFRTKETRYDSDTSENSTDKKLKFKNSMDEKDTLHTPFDKPIVSQKISSDPSCHKGIRLECTQLQQDNEPITRHKIHVDQNAMPTMNQHSKSIDISEEEKGHIFSKSFVSKNSNSDFGIQVTNVNLKIKDKDKTQDLIKDSLEGIKIEINVSCTERNSKSHELDNRLVCKSMCFGSTENRSICHLNDSFTQAIGTCSLNTSDCQCHVYTKEFKIKDNPILSKPHTVLESTGLSVEATPTELYKRNSDVPITMDDKVPNYVQKKSEIDSEVIKDTSASINCKEVCNTILEKQSINQFCGTFNVSTKGTSSDCKLATVGNIESSQKVMENDNYPHKSPDGTKMDSNIISGATNLESKASVKTKHVYQDQKERNSSPILESDSVTRQQMSDAEVNLLDKASLVTSMPVPVNNQKHVEKQLSPIVSDLLTNVKKSPDKNLNTLNSKPSESLNKLDLSFDKLDCDNRLSVTFDHVSPNEVRKFDDNCTVKWKKPKIDHTFKDCDMFESTSGYINPIFSSIDNLEDLHTVPVYTTKDGKISYSPNRRFTYHQLMMEAHGRERSSNARRAYYADTSLSNFYNCPKFRNTYKKRKSFILNNTKRQEKLKDVKVFNELRRTYLDEVYGRNSVNFKDYIPNMKNIIPCSRSCITHTDSTHPSSDIDTKHHGTEETYNEKMATIDVESCESKTMQNDVDLQKKHNQSNVTDFSSSCDAKDTNGKDVQPTEPCCLYNNEKDTDNCDEIEKQKCTNSPASKACVCTKLSSVQEDTVVNEIGALTNECTSNNAGAQHASGSDGTKNDKNDSLTLNAPSETPISDEYSEEKQDNVLHTADTKENKETCVTQVTKSPHMNFEEVKDSTPRCNNFSLSKQEQTDHAKHSECKEITKDTKMNQTGNYQSNIQKTNIFPTHKFPEFSTDTNDTAHLLSENSRSEKFKNILYEEQDVLPDQNLSKWGVENINRSVKDEAQDGSNSFKQHKNEKEEEEENKQETTMSDINTIEIVTDNSTEAVNNNLQTRHQNNTHIDDSTEQNSNETSCKKQEELCCQPFDTNTAIDVLLEDKNTINSEVEKTASVKKYTDEIEYLSFSKDEIDFNTKDIDNEFFTLSRSETIDIDRNFLPDIDKISMEHPESLDFLQEQSSRSSCGTTIPSSSEVENSLSGDDTLIDEKMPILNLYCTSENILDDNTECGKNTTTGDCSENSQSKTCSEKSCDGNIKEKQSYLSTLETCNNVRYSSMSNCNADTKMIPKLVIKKSESLNSKSENASDYEQSNNVDRYDAKLISSPHPKIPKMIITKTRSRSVTPSIEISDKEQPPILGQSDTDTDMENSDVEPPVLKVSNCETKVPKVKIKLEEKSLKELTLSLRHKNVKKSVPKMKIRRIRAELLSSEQDSHTSSLGNVKFQTLRDSIKTNSALDDFHSCDTNVDERVVKDTEKIEKVPKLKLRRQEDDKSSSPERIKRKQGVNTTKLSSKKIKRAEMEDTKQSVKQENALTASDCETQNSLQSMSEKIPKVIIKRSQAGAEFKCEISKNGKTSIIKNANWQPKVKLQRLQALDCIVKNFKHSKFTSRHIPLTTIDKILSSTLKYIKRDSHSSEDTCNFQAKLSRSSSTSNLSPIKCKERRLSDYDYRKVINSKHSTVCSNELTDTSSDNTDGSDESSNCSFNIKNGISKSRDIKEDTNIASGTVSYCDNRNKLSIRKERSRKRSAFKVSHTVYNDSDDELKDTASCMDYPSVVKKENTTNEDVNNSPLINEDNASVIIKKEYLDSDNENEFSLEKKLLKSNTSHSQNFDDNDNSVIKLDSSDESQTTIEILPASPDISQTEIEDDNHAFEKNKNKQLYLEDAIPTQLELELEVIDNNSTEALDVQMAKINGINSTSSSYNHDEKHNQRSRHTEVHPCTKVISAAKRKENTDRVSTDLNYSEVKTADYFYCNDLLVKEVLAAKEKLKKCLARSKACVTAKSKSKSKAFQEDQRISFDFRDLKKTHSKSLSAPHSNDDSTDVRSKTKSADNKRSKPVCKSDNKKAEEKHSKESKHSFTGKKVKQKVVNTEDKASLSLHCTASSHAQISVQDSTTISLKASKQLNRHTPTSGDRLSDTLKKDCFPSDVENNHKKCKSENGTAAIKTTQNLNSKNEKDTTDEISDVKTKEDNMPVLVPEVALNFDPNSDRDSSRSPPVITSQDVVDNCVGNSMNIESKSISAVDKIDEKEKHSNKDCEMTIADIVTRLAYHEKATIKHRRYCNLCERWFPTTSRHRRHLAGYQHRHIELTQRKSIHALFVLFTGKPCPRLLPAHVIRNDCSIGELTPLQIAVQDVAKCMENTQQNLKTKE